MSPAHDLQLLARLQQFGILVAGTVCTDHRACTAPLQETLESIERQLAETRETDGTIYLVGNGGSAAIVSHVQTDLVNAACLRAFTLHEAALLTCMSNDRGYNDAFSETLRRLRPKACDLMIAVSSSGRSPNLIAVANTFLQASGRLITLTGFTPDNPLRKLGHSNLWVESCDYGLVESAHQFLLHNITDRLVATYARSS